MTCLGWLERARTGRRDLLRWLSTAPAALWIEPALAADEIIQPETRGHEAFMARARRMRAQAIADGDQGYGAVIVKAGRIVGEAPSRVVARGDPTAHAETEAIRDACRRLGTRDLSGCTLYSTTRACAMCETAAYWANLSAMYAGDTLTNAGKPRYGGC